MIWRWDLGQRKEKVGESVGPQQCGCRTGSRERNHHDWTTSDGLLEMGVCSLIWNGFSFCAAGHPCDILTLCTTPTPSPRSFGEGQWTAERHTNFRACCLDEWSGGRRHPHLESKVQQKTLELLREVLLEDQRRLKEFLELELGGRHDRK